MKKSLLEFLLIFTFSAFYTEKKNPKQKKKNTNKTNQQTQNSSLDLYHAEFKSLCLIFYYVTGLYFLDRPKESFLLPSVWT